MALSVRTGEGSALSHELSRTGHTIHEKFIALLDVLPNGGKDYRAWEHEYARFSLWADNLGLHHHGHSSLDYRVRDADALRRFTKSLLTDLLENIDDMSTPSASKSSSEPPSDVSDDSEEELDDYGTTSQGEVNLQSVIDILNRLYKLSTKIRNPITRLSSSKASRFEQVDPETGVDLASAWIQFDLWHIEEVLWSLRNTNGIDSILSLRRLDPRRLRQDRSDDEYPLLRRLAKANVMRRKQFGYWRRHKEKVTAETARSIQKPQNKPVPSGKSTGISQTINVSEQAYSVTLFSKPTTATMLPVVDLRNFEEQRSTTSSRTTTPQARQAQDDEVEIPPIPPTLKKEKHFVCPYCFMICSQSVAQPKFWR